MPFRRTRPLLSKGFDQGSCGAGTHWSFRVERENEVGCVGQGLLEHGGDAIGGNDIEPHSRTDHDSGGLCLRVAALRGNEDVDLACDIDIVGSAYEAGLNHWRTGRGKRASAIRHDCHARERRGGRRCIAKIKDPRGQIELGCQPLDWAGTPAGQHRVQTPSCCLDRYKLPGIAVGAVNHPACALCHHRLALIGWAGIWPFARSLH
jgi:hypothetical protein